MVEVQLELSLKTNDLQKKLFESKNLQLNLLKCYSMNSNVIELSRNSNVAGHSLQEALTIEKSQDEHFRLLQMSMLETQKLLNELRSII